MKLIIKLTSILIIATISCPCGLTGHHFCNHRDHKIMSDRASIKALRLEYKTTKPDADSLSTLNL